MLLRVIITTTTSQKVTCCKGDNNLETMSFTINQKVIFAVRAKNLELLKERISDGGDINYQDPIHSSALQLQLVMKMM